MYGTQRQHPDASARNTALIKAIQEHLSGLGRVPWVVGGDWNMTPEDVQLQSLRGGHFHIPQGPTRTFGRTLDWFLTSTLFLPTVPIIGDLSGSDHFPVTLTIPGTCHVHSDGD